MAEIKGVEIMSVGRWNGHSIMLSTLENVVKGFEATREFALPVLKLGHNTEQELLASDGLPAAGWVTNVYIQGKKLLADFQDIPEKIFKLIKNKAYRKVSVEIFQGYKFKGKEFNDLLGAVALLGADMPAMKNLNDIVALYSSDTRQTFTNEENADTIKTKITMTPEITKVADNKTENQEVAELRKQLADTKKDFTAQLDQVKNEKEETLKSFSSYKESTDKKLTDIQSERDQIKVKNFCLDMSKKDLIAPSMEPIIEALLSNTDKKVFSVGEKKDLTAENLIENMLTLAKEVYSINKEEKTKNVVPDNKDGADKLNEEINKFMSDNPGTNYSQAYKHILKQKQA